MTETEKPRHLGYMLPVLLFVLFFSLCSAVLACVFLRAETLSGQAEAYNTGVQLCRNQAERFRAEPEISEGTRAYFYDETLQSVEKIHAEYYVTLDISREPAAAGDLYTGAISAFTMAGERLYNLDVTVYRSDGR